MFTIALLWPGPTVIIFWGQWERVPHGVVVTIRGASHNMRIFPAVVAGFKRTVGFNKGFIGSHTV
jgi:hypothetical protein